GHRGGFNDGDFRVTAVTGNAWMSTNTIPVADASRFAVGDVITIDMLDGPAIPTGSVQLNASFVWFYDGVYFKRQPSFSWAGPGPGPPGINGGAPPSANPAAVNAVPRWRSVGQASEITAISGNTLYLKEPLTKDFMLSRSPQGWRMGEVGREE